MIPSYQSAEEKIQYKIQSLIIQKKALEKKQAEVLYKKCKAFLKEDFHIHVILNMLEEIWASKTPEQLARWRRQTDTKSSKTHQSRSAHSKASQKVHNENQERANHDTIS